MRYISRSTEDEARNEERAGAISHTRTDQGKPEKPGKEEVVQ